MIRNFIFCVSLIFLYPYNGYSQDFLVLEAKRAFRQNGKKIKKGDLLSKREIVTIKEDGKMILDVESTIDLALSAGVHDIDSLNTINTIRYQNHDSLVNVLEKRGLLPCKFRYQVWLVLGTNRHYEADRIAISNPEKIKVNHGASTPVSIEWNNPDKKYKGDYLVIIRDAFTQGFIDILETSNNSISLYPENYDHQYMIYYIQAEDCRASRIHKIEVTH